jgi:hypothetical protein
MALMKSTGSSRSFVKASSRSSSSNNALIAAAGGDPLLLSFYGTAAAYNKSLRKELISMRTKRDKFLMGRLRILRPFLIKKVRAPYSHHWCMRLAMRMSVV